MMTSFPGSPKILKGALVGIDALNPVGSVVIFQYNPDTMTRRLEARSVSQEGDRGEALRLTGAPKETITLNIEIDVVDQLDQANTSLEEFGLHPTLAALEMMLYPKSATVIANKLLASIGTIEIIPVEAPMILFVWGLARVLPVRLTSLNITEETFDKKLNPIRAKIEVSLSVLSYQDLSTLSPGFGLFLAHHIMKEVMTTINVSNSAANLNISI